MHVSKLLASMKAIAIEISEIAHKDDDALLEEDFTALTTPRNRKPYKPFTPVSSTPSKTRV